MIFEAEMDFLRKGRYIANGARAPDTVNGEYARAVSRGTVPIAFTLSALNVDAMSEGIQNAYLRAQISEKYWTYCIIEF